jgi:hypothetical protein
MAHAVGHILALSVVGLSDGSELSSVRGTLHRG